MHDIDAKINEISGQTNYMNQLAKITGDMYKIDINKYKKIIADCSIRDFNLKVLSERFINSKQLSENGLKMFTEFIKNKQDFDITNKTILTEQKRKNSTKQPREYVDSKHRPAEVFKSSWFKSVRNIYKECKAYFNIIYGKNGYSDENSLVYINFVAQIKQNPDLESLSQFAGINVKIDNDKMYINIMNTYKCTKFIINSFMDPMYDVKATIYSNYNIIERAFKTKAIQGTGITSPEVIVDILYNFIVAKYRASITNDNKHYVKLFNSLVDPNSSAELEGSKFLDIMESLNLEELNKNDKVYKFASGVKNIITDVIKNKDMSSEDIAEAINNAFNITETTAVPEHKDAAEFNDLI